MRPAATLDAEHDAIRHLLHALGGMADAVEAGRRVPRHDVEDVLSTLRGFADACHHAKEERVLFPALRRAAPAQAERLVRELEGDHKAGRKLMGLMEARTAGATGEEPAEARPFAHAARLYVTMLERHIENESRDLLPLLESAFPPGEQARLAEELERIEREETGEGAHARYEATIHRLGETYAHPGRPG